MALHVHDERACKIIPVFQTTQTDRLIAFRAIIGGLIRTNVTATFLPVECRNDYFQLTS
jgi:hypothetical protein